MGLIPNAEEPQSREHLLKIVCTLDVCTYIFQMPNFRLVFVFLFGFINKQSASCDYVFSMYAGVRVDVILYIENENYCKVSLFATFKVGIGNLVLIYRNFTEIRMNI